MKEGTKLSEEEQERSCGIIRGTAEEQRAFFVLLQGELATERTAAEPDKVPTHCADCEWNAHDSATTAAAAVAAAAGAADNRCGAGDRFRQTCSEY